MAAVAVTAATLPEGIPDFSLDTSRPGVQSVQTGSWSSPSTWQGGQVPTGNHVVRIVTGHTVTIDDTSAVAYTIAIDGRLVFAPTVSTRLRVTNLLVMAGEMGMGTPGILEVGTAANPIAAGVTAEIVIANTSIGGSVADPQQYGTGLIMLGKVSMHGSVKTPTFVRLATEPRAGQTTLTLSEAVAGWRAGDRLVLPDTRHIKENEVTGAGWMNSSNQWEERTVQAISPDGRTLTLASALQFDHLGARDLNGVLDFLPHVGNLTRNVIVRSESATGTRGHTISTHMAEADIRYALFKDLGRTTYQPLNTTTNAIGRYPVHMHHLSGPMTTPSNGYQFTLLGNAVDGGSAETRFKWGIAVHGSHYGSIKDNVVYNYNGASIATEDGSESFNVFDHNFALRGIGEPNNSVSEARMAMGTEGVGFWFRGPNNFVKNNVAANFQNPTTEAAMGFAYQFRYLGNISVPNFKGAMDPGEFTTRNGNNMPILQFENNEAYGAMQGGFTVWWVSSQDPQPYANAQDSVIKNLTVWNMYNKAVYMYPAQKVIFDGLTIRGNHNAGGRCCGNGVYFADYSSKGIVIRNSDIQGMEEGITAPEAGFGPEPNLTVENSYLRNNSNLQIPTNGSVNGCWMNNKLVVASNTRFEAPPGRSLSSISMVRDVASAPECLSKLNEMRVYAYNGVASDNFQVYHSNSSVVPRPSCGSPITRAGINGPTCTIAAQGPVPPTATFSVSPTSIVERPVRDLELDRDQCHHGLDQSGDRDRCGVGHQECVSDCDDDLHADRDKRRRLGDRHRHRHSRRHEDHADDHLEYTRQHRLWDGIERHAAERDDDGPGVVGVFTGGRNDPPGGSGTDPVGHVYPDRYGHLQLGDRHRDDHRAEGDAADHVGEPGRHQLRDAAQRHAVERDRERGRDVRVRAAGRDRARRRRRPESLRDLHADRNRQLQHGDQDRADYRDRDTDDRAQRRARQCLRRRLAEWRERLGGERQGHSRGRHGPDARPGVVDRRFTDA